MNNPYKDFGNMDVEFRLPDADELEHWDDRSLNVNYAHAAGIIEDSIVTYTRRLTEAEANYMGTEYITSKQLKLHTKLRVTSIDSEDCTCVVADPKTLGSEIIFSIPSFCLSLIKGTTFGYVEDYDEGEVVVNFRRGGFSLGCQEISLTTAIEVAVRLIHEVEESNNQDLKDTLRSAREGLSRLVD